MRWLGWFRREILDAPAGEALDIGRNLTEGLSDPGSARASIARLKRERNVLVRRRKSVEKSLKPLSRGRTRMIAFSAYSNPQNTELGAYQLQQGMRDANDTGHLATQRKEQVAAVDGRIREVDEAVKRLNGFIREGR